MTGIGILILFFTACALTLWSLFRQHHDQMRAMEDRARDQTALLERAKRAHRAVIEPPDQPDRTTETAKAITEAVMNRGALPTNIPGVRSIAPGVEEAERFLAIAESIPPLKNRLDPRQPRLLPVSIAPSGPRTFICAGCNDRITQRIDRVEVFADLNGVPFRDFYCFECASELAWPAELQR